MSCTCKVFDDRPSGRVRIVLDHQLVIPDPDCPEIQALVEKGMIEKGYIPRPHMDKPIRCTNPLPPWSEAPQRDQVKRILEVVQRNPNIDAALEAIDNILIREVEKAVLAERERCAKIAEEFEEDYKRDADRAFREKDIPAANRLYGCGQVYRDFAAAIREGALNE